MDELDEIGAISATNWAQQSTEAREAGLAWFNSAAAEMQEDGDNVPSLRAAIDRLSQEVAAAQSREEDGPELARLATVYEGLRHNLGVFSWSPPIAVAVPQFQDTAVRSYATANPDTVDQVVRALDAQRIPHNHPLWRRANAFAEWWRDNRSAVGTGASALQWFGLTTAPGMIRARAERMAGWLLAQVPRLAISPTPVQPEQRPATPEGRGESTGGGDGALLALAVAVVAGKKKGGRLFGRRRR